ncbi:MAG: hypothetical protein ACLGJB_03735 [Blastocatellia bacterium]
MKLDPTINTGIILQDPQGTDYIAGVNSPIQYKENNPTGDWTAALPSDELQVGLYFDSMACVSFSACNTLETQLNYLKDRLSVDSLQWLHDKGYFDANGKFNFSDRFIAKMSGTTQQGNSMQKVADTIRNCGLVPENVWPAPFRQQNPPFTWSEYYKEIPQEVKNLGLEFKARFDVAYEFVYTEQDKHQKQSPLQVVVATCSGWNDPPVASCPNQPNHAVMQVNNSKVIYDHYNPFKKQLASDYKIYYWMKYVVTEKSMNQAKIVVSKNSPTVYICYPVPRQQHLEERASLEGITIPNPIPNSDSL